MPRNTIQDIVINKNRRLRRSEPSRKEEQDGPALPPRRPKISKLRGESNRFSKYWYIAVALVVFIGLFYIYSSLTASVDIAITPQRHVISLDTIETIAKTGADNTRSFSYGVETFLESDSISIPTSGEKEIDKRAQGQILVFNNNSSKAQKFVARTRFESPDGKVYRITDAIFVPGVTIKDGKRMPGSIEVTVYADEPGEEYNIGLTDLVIPGLKGTALYKNFYARTKTELGGGFSGMKKIIDEQALAQKEKDVRTNLEMIISKKIDGLRESNNLIFDSGTFFVFESKQKDSDSSNDMIDVGVNLSAFIVVIDEQTLLEYLSGKSSDDVDISNMRIDSIDELAISIPNRKDTNIVTDSEISIAMVGDIVLVAIIPEDEIKASLTGLSKDGRDFEALFAENFPSIVEAKVTKFKPFWARKFPKEMDRINIIVKPI